MEWEGGGEPWLTLYVVREDLADEVTFASVEIGRMEEVRHG